MKNNVFSNEITILGYYGNNFGDLLMLNGLLKNLPENYKINILTYSSNLRIQDLEISNQRVSIYDLNKKGKIKTILNSVSKSKKIFWGGGTCFNDIDGTGGIKTMLLCFLIGKKCCYFGIGIDILKKTSSKIYVLIALIISTKIYLRDELSQVYFEKIIPKFLYKYFKKKIKLIPDIASLYFSEKYIEEKIENEGNELLISYRNIDNYFDDHRIFLKKFIINIEDFILKNNIDIINIIDADSDVDKYDSMIIFNELNRNYNVCYKSKISITDKIKLIKRSKYIITGRLHIAFVSLYFNKKFILLNYSDKNRAFIFTNNLPDKILVEYNNLNIPFEFVSYKPQQIQILEKNNYILLALNDFIK